jgi:SnoaL-like domain
MPPNKPIKLTGYAVSLSVGRKDKERTTMIDKKFAEYFARDWIDSWNSHDLERILAHYSDQFEMSSPVIIQVAGEPSGTLKGKDAVGAYWAKALSLIPDLRLERHRLELLGTIRVGTSPPICPMLRKPRLQ